MNGSKCYQHSVGSKSTLPNNQNITTLHAYGCQTTCDRLLDEKQFPLETILHTLELQSSPAELKKELSVQVPLGTSHGRKLTIHTDRELDRPLPGQPWCFDVVGVNRFCWTSGKTTLHYRIGDQGSDDLLYFWFMHIFLPLYFTLEGYYIFLHAGAVEVDGKIILFIAPSMGGKSTLTDYFIKQGHTLVSDDKVATYLQDGKYFAVPSHPYHRPYRGYEKLGHRVTHFSHDPKPIHAIYLLDASSTGADIRISEIMGASKFVTLFPSWLYNFTFLQPKRLKYITDMLNNVSMYSINMPWNLNRLEEIYDAICRHNPH